LDEFTSFLKTQRATHGLSQKELAKKVGVPQTSIGQWERNEVSPTMKNIKKLSIALEIAPVEIFNLLIKRQNDKENT
jgi:transcriptional regulator with XRE-family HTH domain